MSKSIILFGGTFDPIHNGHLHMSQLSYETIQPEKLIFIPCKAPVHKTSPNTTPEDRLEMLKLAIEPYPHYVIDDIELKRESASYTVTTLEEYHAHYPEYKLYWLIGSDSLNQFKSWHKWEKILSLCSLIVIERPQHPAKLSETLGIDPSKVVSIKSEGVDISSTNIRNQFWSNTNIKKFEPEKVAQYISQHNLYKST